MQEIPYEQRKHLLLEMFSLVCQSRAADDKMFKLTRQNKGGGFQLSCAGHELVGIAAAKLLKPGVDWSFPYYRDQGFVLAIGADIGELFAVLLGRACKNHSSGRMMPHHYSHKNLRICCQSSVVGSQLLHAVGRAWAIKQSGEKEVVYVSVGDGATSQGDFHEALNFASIHRLPIIFVVQNNGWAISVPIEEQSAGQRLSHIAHGYHGLQIFECDGSNPEELFSVFSEAIDGARNKYSPSIIYASVVRLESHSNSDDQRKYKTSILLEDEEKKDPKKSFKLLLKKSYDVTDIEILQIQKTAEDVVEKAALEGEAVAFPDAVTINDNLFFQHSEQHQFSQEETPLGVQMVMRDAIAEAIDEEMAKNSHVVVFGEDVAGEKGGVFGVTRGLTQKYGKNRCFNTPLAESTIIGVAIGISFDPKWKAVAEIQFSDYVWPGIDQLFSEAASICYRSNGEWHIPAVFRMTSGGYIQGGPYHSQSIEAFLAHCPGLKVVYPSNARDAKGLLKTAIQDPNPVIFLEHKLLYQRKKFSANVVGSSSDYIPFGKAAIVKDGQDVTVVAWGAALVMSLDAALLLEEEGISVEVIDLRTIVPCDIETVINSVKKTTKLLVVHEAPSNAGFAAEIIAQIMEKAFHYLDAPVKRVCGTNTPVPYSKVLEDAALPQTGEIIQALTDLANF
ncbi:alpha-ketoacid dehydrogenase subunit alpha/beta [Candidatus Clavichlamydia salmonicola]|uniref:alpha-ketoacid dehydrogenase subunit alpha/beta n=1 Tax=Candidatus Clavichlamydia salmonicola TaxID=469812 RepID=UPI0018914C85|nr:thiamine pyrophosphate-dependent enzyme [Candidatus Clavichlamydia salmonicola]